MRSWTFRTLAAALLTLGPLLLAGALPAHAHTRIEITEPADGARLTEAPAAVSVRFEEPISLRDTAVRVAMASGRTVTTGALTSQDTNPTATLGRLPLGALDRGSYIITVTAKGLDGHVVTQTSAFTVGDAELVRTEGTFSTSDSPVVRGTAVVASILTSLSIIAFGAVLILTWCRPTPSASVSSRAATIGLATGVIGALMEGTSLSLAQSADVGQVLATQSGRLVLLRLVGVACTYAACLHSARVGRDPDRLGAAQNWILGASVPFLLAVVGSSHAAGDGWNLVTLVIAMVHLGAVSVWVGGIALLTWAAFRGTNPAPLASSFSRTARVAAVTTLVSGAILAVRLTDIGAREIVFSSYGLVLAVKLALVVALVLTARATHRVVMAIRATSHMRQDAPEEVSAQPIGHTHGHWVGRGRGGLAVDEAEAAPVTIGLDQRLSRALGREAATSAAVLVAASILTVVSRGSL